MEFHTLQTLALRTEFWHQPLGDQNCIKDRLNTLWLNPFFLSKKTLVPSLGKFNIENAALYISSWISLGL